MSFFQTPPRLGNQFEEDAFLRRYLARRIPKDALGHIENELSDLGELAGGELYARHIAERLDEPALTQWDAWGRRVDQIELTPLWKTAQRITADKGIVATAYERKSGESSRIHQFALVYLFDPSTGVYSCPLAMTDGAAKTLSSSGNAALTDRALPRLLSRDAMNAWTSGQWMTERTGGSDVAISETVAKADGDAHRLYGTKWFTSATTSQMALTLARPEGNPPGGGGLALFYVETRNADGTMNGIQINRLKDKLGTRMVPTAELTLDGARATAVMGTKDGIKNITPMLAITRTWNAVCSAAGMRRSLALAKDYAKRRVAFGAPLSEKPLHSETLAWMEAEYRGSFLLAFRAVELLGKEEARTITEEEAKLLRLITPLAKLTTGKQAVSVISEALEAFGGAGYIEDTGLPRLLRDAQVLPIWEGTTNVLSLDVLRALSRGGASPLQPIEDEVRRRVANASTDTKDAGHAAISAMEHAKAWITTAMAEGPAAIEAGARRFAMTLGRALSLSLLVDEATWAKTIGDETTAAAARRYALAGVDLISERADRRDADLLARS